MPQKYAGQTNPLDEMPEPIDMEPVIVLKSRIELTKDAFLKWMSSQIMWCSVCETTHEDNKLYMWIPFHRTIRMMDGRYLDHLEFIDYFSRKLDGVSIMLDHYDGYDLYMWMPFDNAPEYYCGMEDDDA